MTRSGKTRKGQEEITARLREAKKRSGKTLTQLGEESGISESTLQKYFYNGVMPGADKLGSLCRALGASADWVLGLTE